MSKEKAIELARLSLKENEFEDWSPFKNDMEEIIAELEKEPKCKTCGGSGRKPLCIAGSGVQDIPCPDCKPAVNGTEPTELTKELLELANLSPKQRAKTGWSGTDEKAMRKAAAELDRLTAEHKRLREENDQLLELSENLDEHPEGYEGPCLCKLCKSYG